MGIIDFQSQQLSYQEFIGEVETEIMNKGWTFYIEFRILSLYTCNRWSEVRMPLELSQNKKSHSLGFGNLPEGENHTFGAASLSFSHTHLQPVQLLQNMSAQETSQEMNMTLLYWLNHYLLINGLKYALAFYLFVITTFL